MTNYGGFWRRLLACILDDAFFGILVVIYSCIVIIVLPIVILSIAILLKVLTVISNGLAETVRQRYESWHLFILFIIDFYLYNTILLLLVNAFMYSLFTSYIFLVLLAIPLRFLYFAWFQSSVWQATPGKKLLEMMVVDKQYKRLSFGRALLRHLLKIIISPIGYITVPFNKRKRGIYEMLAETYVIIKHKE